MKKNGFTLAEVLITLAIIGVVAAIAVPSVISNSQQQEFKTGLRKAVSVLNSAITMNMALDGETPYDNANTFGFLMKHMSILKSARNTDYWTATFGAGGNYLDMNADNAVFYTTDGMRFEFNGIGSSTSYTSGGHTSLHESGIRPCENLHPNNINYAAYCGGCGSYGLSDNSNKTTKPPCLILVDVNGDKKPTPGNIKCKEYACAVKDNRYFVPIAASKKLRDIFAILITEKSAVPFGVTAQKAMYSAQK